MGKGVEVVQAGPQCVQGFADIEGTVAAGFKQSPHAVVRKRFFQFFRPVEVDQCLVPGAFQDRHRHAPVHELPTQRGKFRGEVLSHGVVE